MVTAAQRPSAGQCPATLSGEARRVWAHLVRGQWRVVEQSDEGATRRIVIERLPAPAAERALSAQQRTVAYWAAQGFSGPEIARRAELSEAAVDTDDDLRKGVGRLREARQTLTDAN